MGAETEIGELGEGECFSSELVLASEAAGAGRLSKGDAGAGSSAEAAAAMSMLMTLKREGVR